MQKKNNLICENCGVSSEERNKLKSYKKGDVLEFGSYPQTIKKETITIINTIQDEKGYFTGSDGEKYALIKANPRYAEGVYSSDVFSNGEKIIKNKEYYFKVEPIKWKVIEEDNDKLFLFSKLLLDNHIFDNNSNDYSLSSIRIWLNNDFYNKAFTDNEKSLITSKTIDTEKNVYEPYGYKVLSESLIDKIFLLSKDDITNKSYGFNNNNDKCKKVTDYAKANGAWEKVVDYDIANGVWKSEESPNGWYWLRNPWSYDDVAGIGGDGCIYKGYVDDKGSGVAPALVINKIK